MLINVDPLSTRETLAASRIVPDSGAMVNGMEVTYYLAGIETNEHKLCVVGVKGGRC